MPDSRDPWKDGIGAEEDAEHALEQSNLAHNRAFTEAMRPGATPAEQAAALEQMDAAGRQLRTDSEHLEKKVQENQRGCVPSGGVMGAVLAVIATAIAAIAVVATRGEDDKASTSNPPVASADGGTSDGAGATDLSAFAGHYVMVSGLDDPTGVDVYFAAGPGPYPTIKPQAGSAELDIGPDGQITGGKYHAGIDVASSNSTCTSFVLDASPKTGSISLSGPGAIGLVEWTGTIARTCPGNDRPTDPGGARHGIGIVGDQLILCRFPDLVVPSECGPSYERVVAKLKRSG